MKTKSTFRKSLTAAAVAAVLGVASSSAMAVFLDFQVTEGNPVSTPGSGPNVFTADKITGGYVERITFGAGTFDASLRWNAGQFFANDGVTPLGPLTQLNSSTLFGQTNGYGIYALFQTTGTFTTSGSGVTTFTTAPGGTLQVFVDPNQNTTFGTPATGASPFTTANSLDDILIATGTGLTGTGTLDPTLPTCGPNPLNPTGSGINCGSFGTTTTFTLTPEGSTYFTAPVPFYDLSFQSGQLNNFTVAGTQTINGSLDVVFGSTAVPEPGTLALLGVAMAGLGFSRRRKLSS